MTQPAAPRIVDSRRLTGPNLFSPRPGAVLEVACGDDERAALLLEWRTIVRSLADRLGWPGAEIILREHPLGAQCFLAAPIDALLAATEVNEAAWHAAERALAGERPRDLRDVAARLRVHRQHEAAPRLVALQHAAAARALTFTFDDDEVSLGAGAGSLTLSRHALPDPAEVPWARLHDVPVALVTGSNGKTTTVRLLAAMLRAAGRVTGLSSTDGVWVDDALVDGGDYSGPGGARLVLRDRRVQAAVLETARGGILRRGIATSRATVAVVTRIAADHLGEYGVHDLHALGEAKLVVARALAPHGRLVLNADDPTLVHLARARHANVTWWSLDAANAVVTRHRATGGDVVVLEDGELRAHGPGGTVSLGHAAGMPVTLGARARHNVANALAASAAALAMGVDAGAVRHALARFGRDARDNEGRLAVFHLRGARVVVDFVHNADGWYALWDALEPRTDARRIVVVGQAGDRDDASLDAMAAAVCHGRPDRVFVKEMAGYARGRPAFEVRDRLAAGMRACGLPDAALQLTEDEGTAVAMALREAREHDLVVLAVHENLPRALRAIAQAGGVAAAAS